LNAAWRSALGLRAPGDVARVFVGKRNTEGGPRNTAIADRSLRAVLGIKGQVAGWDVDVFGQLARVDHDDRLTNYFSNRRIARALDVVAGPDGKPACRAALGGLDGACVPYDLYRTDGVTAAALGYLQTAGASSGYTQQSLLGANLGTDLGRYGWRLPWAEEGAKVSFGAEQRIDRLIYEPDEARRSGDLSGASTTLPVHGTTRLREAYGEFRAPLLEHAALARRLDLSGSYRRTYYSTGAASDTFGLGLDWEPRGGLRVRGSAQRAVRAPNVFELYTPASILLNGPTADPCGGTSPRASQAQCANTGLPAALYGKVPANMTNQYNGRAGGNAAVRPETANTYTAGIVVEPAPGMSFTLDAFHIRVKDAIQPYNAQALFNQCLGTGDPVYCRLVHRDSVGSLWLTPDGYVATSTTNIGSQGTSGLDLGASWRSGPLAVALNGTWVRSFVVENLPGSGSYDCAGLFGATCGLPIPTWRHKLRVTWTSPWNTDLSLTWRYLDRVQNDKRDPNPQLAGALATPRDSFLAARNYLDLSAIARLPGGMTLGAGVHNLLDKDPPFASSASITGILGNGNTYPQLYDTYGRVVYVNLTYRF
jgi:iron complex outermembrane receptor protein